MPRRHEMRTEFVMKPVVCSQLLVDVPELASGITEEHPARDAVVQRAEIQEQQQNSAANHPSIPVEQDVLERRKECQLASRPGHDEERRQRRSERRVRSHCFVSSNAWSIRK